MNRDNTFGGMVSNAFGTVSTLLHATNGVANVAGVLTQAGEELSYAGLNNAQTVRATNQLKNERDRMAQRAELLPEIVQAAQMCKEAETEAAKLGYNFG